MPPLSILDCVLSLNRRYDEFCLPRVEKFANQHPEITTLAALLVLIESYPTPLDFSVSELNYRDEIRAATLVSLLKSLLQVEKAFKDSEETSRLKAWAASVRPTDYEKFGVRGFGLSGFQYLRMLLGVQTIKPDVHIRRFVSDAIGRSVGDEEALALMEAAGNHLEWPLSRLDYAIWDRGARGNENQNSPLYAIALLGELQRDGFTDSSFKIIHHFGRKATIQSFAITAENPSAVSRMTGPTSVFANAYRSFRTRSRGAGLPHLRSLVFLSRSLWRPDWKLLSNEQAVITFQLGRRNPQTTA